MRVASALCAVLLLPLLVFILENSQRVDISDFGAHGHLPPGVALCWLPSWECCSP